MKIRLKKYKDDLDGFQPVKLNYTQERIDEINETFDIYKAKIVKTTNEEADAFLRENTHVFLEFILLDSMMPNYKWSFLLMKYKNKNLPLLFSLKDPDKAIFCWDTSKPLSEYLLEK